MIEIILSGSLDSRTSYFGKEDFNYNDSYASLSIKLFTPFKILKYGSKYRTRILLMEIEIELFDDESKLIFNNSNMCEYRANYTRHLKWLKDFWLPEKKQIIEQQTDDEYDDMPF